MYLRPRCLTLSWQCDPQPIASPVPGNLLKMQILGCTLEWLNVAGEWTWVWKSRSWALATLWVILRYIKNCSFLLQPKVPIWILWFSTDFGEVSVFWKLPLVGSAAVSSYPCSSVYLHLSATVLDPNSGHCLEKKQPQLWETYIPLLGSHCLPPADTSPSSMHNNV